MKWRFWYAILAFGVIALLALNVRVSYAEPVSASSTAGYTIDWWTVDGGGAQALTGGSYMLSGTVGQPDAGAQSGATYSVGGGFWSGGFWYVEVFGFKIDLPLIMR